MKNILKTVRNKITSSVEKKKSFQWPTIDVKRFSGNPHDWLQFWGQYRKIHEDKSIEDEDKFSHLLRFVEEGSRAYVLVSSFPSTRENHKDAFESLKNRFGKDEMQVEVYVRELLSLVLKNALNNKE